MIKVLLVDDDKSNSLLLKRFLEVEDFDVRYAENGRIGLEIYETYRPNIILLDINMPGINGFEVAKRIRENDNDTLIFFLLTALRKPIDCTVSHSARTITFPNRFTRKNL